MAKPKTNNLPLNNLEDYFLYHVQQTAKQVKQQSKGPASNPAEDYAPSSSLRDLRYEIECLDNILLKERARHAIRQQEFMNRWEAASNNLKAVDATITGFELSYNENLREVSRLTQLASRQEELRISKEADVRRLFQQKTYLEAIKMETGERLKNYTGVKTYVQSVVGSSNGEFKDARELMDRAKLLMTTRSELMNRNERDEFKLEARDKQINSIQMVKTNESIILNNYIFELSENLEEGKALYQRLEEELSHIKTSAANGTMILGQTKAAVFNLYVQLCKQFKIAQKIKAKDTIKQLRSIKMSMVEIHKMNVRLHRIIKRAAEKAAAEKMEKIKSNRLAFTKIKRHVPVVGEGNEDQEKLRELFGFRKKSEEQSGIPSNDQQDKSDKILKRQLVRESILELQSKLRVQSMPGKSEATDGSHEFKSTLHSRLHTQASMSKIKHSTPKPT